MMKTKQMLAMYITPRGAALCKKIKALFGDTVDIMRLKPGNFDSAFKQAMAYRSVVAVMAAGIVTRGIAPHLKDKTQDPAVVVMDEAGRNVVSLLSGHIGGANRLAREIAEKTGAHPVITTATDVNELPAIDAFAAERNYAVRNLRLFKKAAMAMLQDRTIGVFLEAGESAEIFKPPVFQICKTAEELTLFKGSKIAVTWRDLGSKNILYLVPKRLVAGMGFHKGVSSKELKAFFSSVLKKYGLFLEAVRTVATIDKRRSERGFQRMCEELCCEPLFFSERELAGVAGLTQSETVKKYHATGNISEASAVLGSGNGSIILPKQKGGAITVCVAIRNK